MIESSILKLCTTKYIKYITIYIYIYIYIYITTYVYIQNHYLGYVEVLSENAINKFS